MSLYDQNDGSTTAQRCLNLLQKYGPRFMRIGGCGNGGVSREVPGSDRRMSDADKRAILDAAALGGTHEQIGARVGWSDSSVRKVLKLAGFAKPDGRAGRISRRKLTQPRQVCDGAAAENLTTRGQDLAAINHNGPLAPRAPSLAAA